MKQQNLCVSDRETVLQREEVSDEGRFLNEEEEGEYEEDDERGKEEDAIVNIYCC